MAAAVAALSASRTEIRAMPTFPVAAAAAAAAGASAAQALDTPLCSPKLAFHHVCKQNPSLYFFLLSVMSYSQCLLENLKYIFLVWFQS